VADDAVLVISFVGYENAAIKASAGPEITARMKKKAVVMKTVVVVGYAPNSTDASVAPPPPPPSSIPSDIPPPPPPPPPSALEGNPLIVIDGVISKKPFSEISPEEIASINVLKGETAVKNYGEKGKEGVIEVTTKKAADQKQAPGSDIQKKSSGEKEVFVVVEEMPVFPGGNEAMFAFVANNFKYPAEARAQNITGLVRVSFVVRASGKVSDVKVEQSAHPLLDAEAVRVVKSMPDWKPGKQHGKPVDVDFTIPVDFHMQGEKKVSK
jgi:TonB family protein